MEDMAPYNENPDQALRRARRMHRMHRMHRNSMEANRNANAEQHKRCRDIIAEIRKNGPGTDHELAIRLGLHHRQDVAPRVTTLLSMTILAEINVRKDPVTRKNVRVVGLVEPSAQARKELRGTLGDADGRGGPHNGTEPSSAAREAWRLTVGAAAPGLAPVVSDQLDLGLEAV